MLSGEPICGSLVLYKHQMLMCSRKPGKVLSEARGACGVIVRLSVNAAGCRVKLEDRLATVTSAREAADSAAVARELDCERHLDHLDSALQVCRTTPIRPIMTAMQCVHIECKMLESFNAGCAGA